MSHDGKKLETKKIKLKLKGHRSKLYCLSDEKPNHTEEEKLLTITYVHSI